MSAPLSIDIATTLTLDTEVGATYRQVSEDGYASRPVTLLDAIVESAARQLVAKVIQDETAYRGMRDKVRERLVAIIDERIAPMVDEAIATPVQTTNAFGEPTGKTTTMRELVIDAARNQMKRTTDRYGRNKSALDTALADVTAEVIGKELREEVTAAKARVRAAVQTVTSQHLAEQLARQLGVKP